MASAAPAFPGYRVLGLIGHGGMGNVYAAEDELLGRKVAIKTILPAVTGEGTARARFLREARAMATVEHARVVRVYSFGEAAGQAYFVMELVEGETLQARLQRTPQLACDEALRIAREVAEALAAAWARGIVHRDVKPSNIILDRDGHVHVADFGLARPAEGGGDASVTRDGAFVGSPHYVAPEQARAQGADFRTDIYSLGIVLFEMIAGRRPFDGPTAMEVVSRQLTEPVPPLRSFAPRTPEPVDRIVHAMTAKNPTSRPASYPTLIASLSGTTPIEESLPTSSMPGSVPVARGRRSVPAAGVLALALLGGVGYALRDRLTPVARPPGDFVVALAPFFGSDEESAKEGKALALLVLSETRRLLGDEDGRSVGLASATEPARDVRAARRLGERVRADVVLWGETLAFRGAIETQPALTRVAEGAAPPQRPGTLLFDAQAPSPIELRRKGALRLAEAVVRLAAQAALDAGKPEAALRLLQECRPAPETLELRAAALARQTPRR